jgi:tRNA pseudouridine55 synthase
MTPSKPKRFDRAVDGILLLDKPVGLSSNAALQQARVLFRALKAGHAGSLDPMASGMLPICFGEATKVCAFLLDSGKRYQFVARLGERSDTGDAEGQIVERLDVPSLTRAQIETVLSDSLGMQTQVPPMYSALKHQGERLYALARRGETVDRPPRSIRLDELTLLNQSSTELEIAVRCSKGTYVRTLAEDLAVKLGTIAHLTALRRVEVDPFGSRAMYSLAQLESIAAGGLAALDSLLLSADEALPHLASLTVDAAGREDLQHGRNTRGHPPSGVANPGETVRMYGPEGEFLGLGEIDATGCIQPRRLLVKSASVQ